MLNLFFAQILPPLVQLFGLAVGLVVSFYGARILAGIQAKVTNQRAADALTFVTRQVTALVLAAADEVRDLKAPDKPGQWTASIARSVRDRVVTDALRLAPGAIAELRRILGLDEAGLRKLLTQITEAQVESLRREASFGASLVGAVGPVIPAVEPSKVPAAVVPLPRDNPQSGRASLSLLVLLVIVGALALVGAALTGCPTYQRPACEVPGTYRCAGDRPQYCAPSKMWTTAGSTVCGPAEACEINAEGVAHCNPITADGGTR